MAINNPIERRAALRPTASPIDAYVRPQQPQRSELWDLADGLKGLESGLASWVQSREGEQREEDRLRGEAQFYRDNAAGMAEGVRSGAIPAFASPDFKRGYKRAEGEALAGRFESDFAGAYSMWEGKENEDPAAFDQFFNNYVRDYLSKAGDDPDLLRGFLPQFRQTADRVRAANTRDRADAVYQRGLKAHSAAVNQLIDTSSDDGLLRPEGADYDGLWVNILRVREQALSVGVRSEDFDKELMKTISAKALEIGDHNLVELLDRELPGAGYKMSDLPDGQDIKADTIDKLTDLALRREEADRKRQEREDKQRYNGNLSKVLAGITEDPNMVVPDDVLKEMEKHDPDVRLKIAGARKTLAEAGAGVEDPAEIRDLYSRIMDGSAGKAQILKAIESGIVRDPSTINALTTFADKVQGDGGAAAGMLKSQTAKSYLDAIKQRTAPADAIENAFGMPGGLTDSGFQATADFRRAVYEWAAANPNATPEQQDEALDRLGQRVIKLIEVDTGQPVGNRYTGPSGQRQAPPPSPTEVEPAGSTQEQTPAGTETTPEQEWLRAPQGEPSWTRQPTLQDLSPEQRQLIENAAKRRGVPPDLFLEQQWRRLQQLQQPPQEAGEGEDEVGAILDAARQAAQGLAALGEQSSPSSTGSGRFVDPRRNPDVNQAILARHKGRRLPVVIRNNNPAALSLMQPGSGEFAERMPGYVGATPRPKNEGGYYAKFATPEHGVYANAQLLARYGQRGTNTASQIVRRWSTDSSAWDGYAEKIAAAGGVGVDDPIDLSDPAIQAKILAAKSAHESGTGQPIYNQAVFERGARGEFSTALEDEKALS